MCDDIIVVVSMEKSQTTNNNYDHTEYKKRDDTVAGRAATRKGRW